MILKAVCRKGKAKIGICQPYENPLSLPGMPWDYPDVEYRKQAAADPVWHLERLINHGLGDEKLDRELLKQFLPELHIPEDRRAFLELLIWDKPL